MRYKKLSLLLVISLVFFLVLSLILISAWFYYYFYDNNRKGAVKGTVINLADEHRTRDSLQKLYTASIGSFDTSAAIENGDSIRKDFNSKMSEFYKLRNEITNILRSRTSPDDLELARQKIGTLQQKIEELRSRTIKVEYENKRLNALLLQLSKELKGQEAQARRGSPATTKTIPDKPAAPPVFTIADVKLSGFAMDQEQEMETTEADKVEKMVGTFTVRNNASQIDGTELMVVVLQPDGRVLQSSAWESGTFETRDGKKIYSSKIAFDYNKGETKRLSFSIRNESFQKGEYTVQVYQNGVVVGKGSKNLQ